MSSLLNSKSNSNSTKKSNKRTKTQQHANNRTNNQAMHDSYDCPKLFWPNMLEVPANPLEPTSG